MQRLVDPVLVQRAITPPGETGRVESPQLHRVWPVGDSGACALWTNSATSRFWPIIRPGKEKDLRALAAAVADGRARLIPALPGFLLDFPADPLLPQLAGIQEQTGGAASAAKSTDSRPSLVSYKPLRRCVFRVRDDETVRFVKCVNPRRVEGLAAVYNLLGKADGLGYASPEEVSPEQGVLTWRRIYGAPLTGVLATASAAASDGLTETGRNLAALHSSGLRFPATHDRNRELATLRTWVELAMAVFPQYKNRFLRSFAELETASAQQPAAALLPAHRDFHDGQVLITPAGAVFLDFDTAALAEAELDVGNFLAHLEL